MIWVAYFMMIHREMDPSLRLGVSQIIRRLVENFGLTVLLQIPVFQEFLAHITELSGRIIIESNNEVDDTWYMESFDELLESWASMLVQLDALNEPGYDVPQGINLQHFNLIFREASSHVFQRYVSTRIDFANETLDEELLGDMKDREIYADQLISIALLGRLLGSKGILFLHQQLVDRMQRFEQLLSQQTLDETMLHSLHDHLHWILLISAYVVADSQQGEVPCIPAVFLADRVPDQEAHPIIALFQTTLQFLAFLTSKSVSSQSHLLSPLVVETLIWFLSRFTATYFHPSTEGGDVPPSILNAFTGSSCAQFLSFLIEQLQPALIHWSAELEVVESVTELLESLSEKESIRRDIMALPRWKSTAAFLVEHLSAIVGEMHCRLIAALVKLGSCHQISGSASENAQSMDMAYFEAIFLMIEVILNIERIKCFLLKFTETANEQCETRHQRHYIARSLDTITATGLHGTLFGTCDISRHDKQAHCSRILGETCRYAFATDGTLPRHSRNHLLHLAILGTIHGTTCSSRR